LAFLGFERRFGRAKAKLQINAISVSEKWRRGAGFQGHKKNPDFLGVFFCV